MNVFWTFAIFIILTLVAGLYCVLASYNLIRALIGVELLLKAVSLLIIAAGFVTGRTALAQALVITFITVEVVVMTVALGIVVGINQHNKSLDAREIKNVQ
ncbi:MAG: NADH-quinone oxidoreductase subunit K [Deltaproteobacteria bacterium]